MVDVLFLLGEHKLEETDEIQLQVMVEMVEVHLLLQSVERHQSQTEIDEIHYMVMVETERMQ